MRAAGEAAARFAARRLARLDPPCPARVVWTGDGLLVRAPKGATGLVVRPPSWSLPGSPGLVERRPSLVAPVGAAAVLTACILDAMPGVGKNEVVASIDPLISPRSPAAGEWLGFRRVADGWVGVASVGAETARRLEAGWAAGDLDHRTAVASSVYLQSMGIATLPARSAPPTGGWAAVGPIHQGLGGTSWPLIDVRGHASLPMDGWTVLDLGRVVAAPFAAQVLARLGARVISVRPPGMGARWGGGEEVDLRDDGGVARLGEILEETDLVVENFRPRAWSQLLAPSTAARVRRRVGLRGFPGASPLANWKAYGFLVEAWMGLGPGPADGAGHEVRAGPVPLWDRVTGVLAAAASLRLMTRARGTAEVSQVDVALDALSTMQAWRRQVGSDAA